MTSSFWPPTIPADVLLNIFRMGTLVNTTNEQAFAFPLLVCKVSRNWREIALSSPLLWTTICCEGPCPKGLFNGSNVLVAGRFSPSSVFPITSLFLECSRQHTLTIDLDLTLLTECMDKMDIGKWVFHTFIFPAYGQIFAPHVSRIRKFYLLGLDFDSTLEFCMNLPHLAMPNLEEWRVEHPDANISFKDTLQPTNPTRKSSDLLRLTGVTHHEAPAFFERYYLRLVSLKVTGMPLCWSSLAPKNLRSLSLSFLPTNQRPDAKEFRELLHTNAHSLVDLELQGAMPWDTCRLVTLPALTELSIGYNHPGEAIPFITGIDVPNLQIFSIHDIRRYLSVTQGERYEEGPKGMTILLFETLMLSLP